MKNMSLDKNRLSRRSFGLMLGAGAVGGAACSAAPSIASATQDGYLDLSKPADNLKAFMKIRGSLGSERQVFLVLGRVFGLLPNQSPIPLFRVHAFENCWCERQTDLRYLMKTTYFAMYSSMDSNERAERLFNPITGKTINTPIRRLGPGTVVVTGEGYNELDENGSPNVPKNPSAIRPWSLADGTLEMTDQVIMDNLTQINMFSNLAAWDDIQNPDTNSVPTDRALSTIGNWRDWLEMGDIEGRLLWHVTLVKLPNGIDGLPGYLRKVAEKEWPESLI